MARFRTQVSKGIEEVNTETNNHNLETRNHSASDGVETSRNDLPEQESLDSGVEDNGSVSMSPLYSDSDMELVNVAGFKVPYVVREHWKKGCRKKRVKLSPMLKSILANEFGLPPGISLEDL
ncbi:MAG: hypothetical protein AB4050_11545 [Synechococcus sp.]